MIEPMRFPATVLLFVALSCTAANPHYIGDSSVGGNNDFGQADLAATACSSDARACLGLSTSAHCQNGAFSPDRSCPPSSMCTNGYCAPPPPPVTQPSEVGQRCDSNGGPQERQCAAVFAAMLSCQPFVDLSALKILWYCAQPVGSGSAGVKCTRGAECRSGVCSADAICFVACQSDFDCPSTLTRPLHCKSVSVTVEGVTQSFQSCTPN
jgi:hypothetical protein